MGGDYFYVRAYFNYKAENEGELSISSGDLLLVENSLVHGQIGKWYVWKIDDRDNKQKGGIVPSRIRSVDHKYSHTHVNTYASVYVVNASVNFILFFYQFGGVFLTQKKLFRCDA